MLDIGDAVRLKKPFAEDDLLIGAEGAVVMCFSEPSEGFEVEFLDDEGFTTAVLTLEPDDFEAV